MYRNYILPLLIIFIFFSCDKKQKHETQKKEIFFRPPVTIIASNPIIILLDTCPKPNIIVIPTKDSSKCDIKTQNGFKTIKLFPIKKIPILAGEAGGYTFMQHFNTEQGLGLSGINCGYKDKTGNLWFGTAGGGVSKYDGKSFTNYTPS